MYRCVCNFVVAWFCFVVFCNVASAQIFNVDECSEIVSTVNAGLPQKVDKATTLRSSTCLANGIVAEFTYIYDLDMKQINVSSLPQSFVDTVIANVCSGPDTRVFLDGLTLLTYDYFEADTGKFFDRIQFSNKDC